MNTNKKGMQGKSKHTFLSVSKNHDEEITTKQSLTAFLAKSSPIIIQ